MKKYEIQGLFGDTIILQDLHSDPFDLIQMLPKILPSSSREKLIEDCQKTKSSETRKIAEIIIQYYEEKKKMDYTEALIELAQESMTEKGFKLLMYIEDRMPDIWNKPSSSTGKYHKKANGEVPSIAKHTYEMLHAAVKIIRMFGGKLKSIENDVFVMAIVLHDIQKYGPKGNMPHTNRYHDRSMADLLDKNSKVLLDHFSDFQAGDLVSGVRYHSGRWSKSVDNIHEFDFADYPPIVMFLHMLDMMSTADVIRCPNHSDDDLPF